MIKAYFNLLKTIDDYPRYDRAALSSAVERCEKVLEEEQIDGRYLTDN